MGTFSAARPARPFAALVAAASLALIGAPAIHGAEPSSYYAGLSTNELLKESEAALHLGFITPTSLTEGLNLPLAGDLADQALVRPNPSSGDLLTAWDLKLRLADIQNAPAAWSAVYAALPASVNGVSATRWSASKNYWLARHQTALGQWASASTTLLSIEGQNIPEPLQTGYKLLIAQAEIRDTHGAIATYEALTDTLADISGGGDVFSSEPMAGMTEFTALDFWPAQKSVMDRLAQHVDKPICVRRWLEFAAPSALNPLSPPFPEAPRDEQNALRRQYQELANQFAQYALQPIPRTGGYRELLAYQLRMENLAFCGKTSELVDAAEALPTEVAGVPDVIWTNGYKITWRTLGDAGSLAIGNIIDGLPEIQAMAEIMPSGFIKALAETAVGLALMSRNDTSGLVWYARALNNRIPYPLLTDQIVRLLQTGRDIPAEHNQQILAALNPDAVSDPSVAAQVRSTRALFLIKRADKLDPGAKDQALRGAVRDAAIAIHGLERRAEPIQAHWRKKLRDPLRSAIVSVAGPEAADAAIAQLSGPVKENDVLGASLPPAARNETVPPVMTNSISIFDQLAAEGAGGSEVRTLSDAALIQALNSIPASFTSGRQFKLAHFVTRECDRRGGLLESLPANDRDDARLRKAEITLAIHGRSGAAEREITALAAGAAEPRVQAQAGVILGALNGMPTLDSYLWAQDWLIFAEREFTADPPRIVARLRRELVTAVDRPETLSYLSDPATPTLVRLHHYYNIARAFLDQGDEATALRYFELVINASDLEIEGDSIVRPLAEAWRMSIWARQAQRAQNPEERELAYRRILNYSRSRIPTLTGPDEAWIEFAKWGRMAAKRVGDEQAVREFEFYANRRARTRLF